MMIVGTRGSQLALAQTKQVCSDLSKITGKDIDVEIIKTKGDKITTSQLYNMDSKGLFTKELDIALLEEEVDFTVHSVKDLPTELDEDLEVVAVPKRESPHEVLISNKTWDELGPGSRLGTSSLRREAFCNHYEKEFELKPIRGNIETRIQKALSDDLDATIMAEAGLKRLNLTEYIKTVFPLNYITPPAGQGALAIETRADDKETRDMLAFLRDDETICCAEAERSFLARVEGGCQVPVGVYATAEGDDLKVEAVIASLDGRRSYRGTVNGAKADAAKLGKGLAEKLLNEGGAKILQELGLLLES